MPLFVLPLIGLGGAIVGLGSHIADAARARNEAESARAYATMTGTQAAASALTPELIVPVVLIAGVVFVLSRPRTRR